MQSSDTKSKKKKKTKKGKKRRGKGDTSESEEDVPVMHAVSTVVDAPEGPGSDRDDENQHDNDPYKKLDINLDEPLRDDEILPVPQHRVVASSLEGAEAEAEAPRKKHREKTKDKSKKKDKKEKDKKEKKKKHRSKEEPALLMEEAGAGGEVVAAQAATAPSDLALQQNPTDEKANDIEFWLSTNEISTTPASAPAASSSAGLSVPTVAITKPANDLPSSEEEDAGAAREPKKKKEKKVKKDKKEKKKKKERAKRSEYEQPEGITTPSKEQLTQSQEATPMDVQLPPMSSYQLLAENAAMKMMYETRVSPQRSDQIIVSVVFSNLTMKNLKDLEFNVLDTLNTKMVRGLGHTHHDPVKVPFVLLPGAQNEGQFAFSTENITVAQKLRGTLTYILKTEDGSTHEKVDFKLGLPSSAYLVSTPSSSADFAALLSNGDLSAKSSAKIPAADTVFSHILAKVCFHLHFRVVEQVGNTASLFARSIQGHPVCLLVKSVEEGVNVDGKSSDDRLLDSIMSEIKDVLAQTST